MVEKPKTSMAFGEVQDYVKSLIDSGKAEVRGVDKPDAGALYLSADELPALARFTEPQGIAVKILGENSGNMIRIGFRSLVMLDAVSPNFTSSDGDFQNMSLECETT
ncbi:hypothetical protein [Mesorhizobium escarrei]|uniref:Uncharacterized protein n=1 Tax=Mesorhizobium escarrei TaxID=666018 RepID=A0ABM9E1X8_9HYPH|nr:hypothetical protein [Mesorhizobium escarrei]CAH2403020.1 hypothetical protein MES5069_360116 [Mesorhizobium escarrei]